MGRPQWKQLSFKGQGSEGRPATILADAEGIEGGSLPAGAMPVIHAPDSPSIFDIPGIRQHHDGYSPLLMVSAGFGVAHTSIRRIFPFLRSEEHTSELQ